MSDLIRTIEGTGDQKDSNEIRKAYKEEYEEERNKAAANNNMELLAEMEAQRKEKEDRDRKVEEEKENIECAMRLANQQEAMHQEMQEQQKRTYETLFDSSDMTKNLPRMKRDQLAQSNFLMQVLAQNAQERNGRMLVRGK